jgi:hypothetical protein
MSTPHRVECTKLGEILEISHDSVIDKSFSQKGEYVS